MVKNEVYVVVFFNKISLYFIEKYINFILSILIELNSHATEQFSIRQFRLTKWSFLVHSTMRIAPYVHQRHDSIFEL